MRESFVIYLELQILTKKQNTMKRFLSACLVILTLLPLAAKGPKKDLSYFWRDKDGLINAQTEFVLEHVSDLLEADKPTPGEPSMLRKSALYLLDQIFHDTRLDGSPIVSAFLDKRMESVLASLAKPQKEGVTVYKLYNDGWIIRTPKVTIGWDIYRGRDVNGAERRLMSDSIARALVNECDILFLTHNHPDHVDPFVVDCFVAQNKPVIATDEILPDNKGVTHFRKPVITETQFKAANGAKLKATVVPGHQDELQNNIYVVTTPDGYTVCSTGDQWLKSDQEMVLNLQGEIPEVDVLLPICWAAKLPELCRSFGAKLVLTGHENELGHHTIDHREAYWLSMYKLEDVTVPSALLTWGESIHYAH